MMKVRHAIGAALILMLPVMATAEIAPEVAAKTERKALQEKVSRGDVLAMVDLAARQEQGDAASPPERAAALDLYEKAADRGDPAGRQKMCIAYLLGEGRPKDAVRGMSYCNALGTKDAVGLFSVAYDYQEGLSGPKDEAQAMSLYVEAVRLGSGDAATALGHKALEIGKPDVARQWFRRGTYLGSADAMDELAAMTAAGQGGPADAAEAQWLYGAAAAFGNAHAAAQPAAGSLPFALATAEGKADMPLTRTWSDGGGAHRKTIDLKQLTDDLGERFPRLAIDEPVWGYVRAECYIALDHSIDACVVRGEHPVAMGYAAMIETLVNGHVTVGERDAAGQSTAGRLLQIAQGRWLNHVVYVR